MNRRLAILGGVVAALAFFVFLWEIPRERAAQRLEEEEGQLLDFDSAAVDTVAIRRNEGSILLARRDATSWHLLAPVQDAVTDRSVENLLTRLTQLRRERVLLARADTGGLEDFGLGPVETGSVLVEVVTRDGARHGLYIGRQTPSRQNTYVRRAGSETVELAPVELSSVAAVSHQGFRVPDLFVLADSTIVNVRIGLAPRQLEVVREDGGLWHVQGDASQWIRHHRMQSINFTLRTARIARYAADAVAPDQWALYGLDPPLAAVEFRTADGRSFSLQMGNEDEPGEVFARRGQEATLLTVDSRLADDAQLTLEDLRDTNPIREVFDDLSSFTLRWETGGRLGAARQGKDWLTLLPADFTGDPETLITPLRNVLLGLEGFQTEGQMIVSKTQDPTSVLDRVPVRGELNWPDRTVGFALGWRQGELAHWFHLEGEAGLHQISRDLFLRLRGYMQVAGAI